MNQSYLLHIRPEIIEMGAYHVPDASGLIKLDAMENPYTLPEDLKAQLAAHLAQVALNRYPVPSYTALKDALRAYAHIPADKDIMLGNGSDELIAILSQAVSKPNETVTVLAPARQTIRSASANAAAVSSMNGVSVACTPAAS